MPRKLFFAAAAAVALAAHSQAIGLIALASLVVPLGFLRTACSAVREHCLKPFAAGLLVLLLAFATLAPAQAAGVTSVDLQPFLAQIIDLAIMVTGPPAAALIVGVIFRLYRWVGVKRSATEDAQIQANVDQAIAMAMTYARQKARVLGPVTVDVRSEVIAHAAEYAMQAIPGTLKKLGIADKASERLSNMIAARLGAA